MIKIGQLIERLESYKNHYGYDHPVTFKVNGKTLDNPNIAIIENDTYPDMGTIIILKEKEKEDI